MDADEALSKYLETYEADEIFNNYFTAIRNAFLAGYKAAGGEIPAEQLIVRLLRQEKTQK